MNRPVFRFYILLIMGLQVAWLPAAHSSPSKQETAEYIARKLPNYQSHPSENRGQPICKKVNARATIIVSYRNDNVEFKNNYCTLKYDDLAEIKHEAKFGTHGESREVSTYTVNLGDIDPSSIQVVDTSYGYVKPANSGYAYAVDFKTTENKETIKHERHGYNFCDDDHWSHKTWMSSQGRINFVKKDPADRIARALGNLVKHCGGKAELF